MKILKIIAVVLLIAFIGIQFLPKQINKSETTSKADFLVVNKVPANIKNKLQVSCYDCHSNNTRYPWYNKIQPAAMFLENHVKGGKKELNFSEWDSLSVRRKKSKLKAIINQLKDDQMPLSSYTIIHTDAKFTVAEKQEMIQWMTQKKDSL
ncbi:Haem-binding domain-containing protein [Halpernia humi]|uniref:Haem-binding domain-containing protein n=1 Tax=Halpernia humi TaxID=493375 RepID=A0A1H5WZ16_9FLAO|nr:heme-binding domain-containing protein [Halpernia humi]SEG04505.1 Haem-binding domain-containing protein [Halpernia humi]